MLLERQRLLFASSARSEGHVARRDIIVIGGSAGSHSALRRIMSDLPSGMQATILVTTHVPSSSPSHLAESLASAGPLPVSQAVDGQPLEQGQVYTAVPDRHLLLVDGIMRLGEGPRENMTRPAIDPLFRSAALAYGSRTVGVLLSGMLNDGASGLCAIKACGGTAIVQHPLDADSNQMPLAALEAVAADKVAPASELGGLLAQMAKTEAGEEVRSTTSFSPSPASLSITLSPRRTPSTRPRRGSRARWRSSSSEATSMSSSGRARRSRACSSMCAEFAM